MVVLKALEKPYPFQNTGGTSAYLKTELLILNACKKLP
jgi:hypothetical protein